MSSLIEILSIWASILNANPLRRIWSKVSLASLTCSIFFQYFIFLTFSRQTFFSILIRKCIIWTSITNSIYWKYFISRTLDNWTFPSIRWYSLEIRTNFTFSIFPYILSTGCLTWLTKCTTFCITWTCELWTFFTLSIKV